MKLMKDGAQCVRASDVLAAFTTLAALGVGSGAWSATITVDDDGPADHSTLQAAINAAMNGDTILVKPGTYTGALAIGSKYLTVRGDAPASEVVVRVGDGGELMNISQGQSNALRFENLTFTGGVNTRLIQVSNSSPVFERCVFRDNLRGAIVDAHSCGSVSGGTYRSCLFLNNREPNGGAVYFLHANSVVEDCAFIGNQAVGPTSGVNAGGSVYVNDWGCGTHTFRFTRCHFVGNSAVWGGAIYSQGTFPNSPTQMPVTNCVFVANNATQGKSMWNWYITAPISGSWFCGGSDQIRNWWVDAGGNNLNGSCSDLPYADCDGDTLSDQLEIALGFDSDCNLNQLPDACEIVEGKASDADGDGIIDSCDGVLLVPEEFATIQAAIDSVAVGSSAIVRVGAGLHAGGFSLGGKDVVVEGVDAVDGVAVIDGTGLSGPAIRFEGGEPSTAGIRALVIRHARAGELIGYDRYGGGIFATNSSAFVEECRFEGCGSDVGAAVAFLSCTIRVSRCTFVDGTATYHGGGIAAFGSDGIVRESVFEGNLAGLAGGSGSGVYIEDPSGLLELIDSSMTWNVAAISGAAVEYADLPATTGSLRITGCEISSNVAGASSGFVGVDAGGLRVYAYNSQCVLSDGTRLCDNEPRNVDGAYLVEGSVEVCDPVGDINENGVVDGEDMAALLAAWGVSDGVSLADLSRDGIVDGADLTLLLNSWGPVVGGGSKRE